MSVQAQSHLSVEEYLDLERQAEVRSEYLDGETFALAGGELGEYFGRCGRLRLTVPPPRVRLSAVARRHMAGGTMRIIEIRADDKLALSLERRARSESKTLEAVAADALLAYARSMPLQRRSGSQNGEPYRIKPFASGKCLLGDLSSTSKVLAWAEGDDFR